MNAATDFCALIATLKHELPLLQERYDVQSLGIFGSYVHGTQRDDSDIDLLVTFRRTPGLLKFIELENYLSDLIGKKVDLVMKDALKPRIGAGVLKDVVTV
jgi:uncharacterized protein